MKIFLISFIAILLMCSIAFTDTGNYDKGLVYYNKGDFNAAIKYLKEYVAKKPDPYAYYLLGYAYYKIGKYPESAKYFQEAYMVDPEISPSAVTSTR